jgi:hypothetical protein
MKRKLSQFWNPTCRMWALWDDRADRIVAYRKDRMRSIEVIEIPCACNEARARRPVRGS